MVWLLLVIPCLVWGEKPEYRFSNIHLDQGTVRSDFDVRGLFPDDVVSGIRKGMTAALEYQVQCWKKRPHWVDVQISQKIFRMKISYDHWQKGYVLTRKDTTLQPVSEDTLMQKYSRLRNFLVIDENSLEQGQEYYIAVKIILRPMTIDNYDEIRRWLSGEFREIHPKKITSPSAGKKVGDWFFGLLRNVTGFGDRVLMAKSSPFIYKKNSIRMNDR